MYNREREKGEGGARERWGIENMFGEEYETRS